ncbi:MAG: hypothetical protein QOD69_3222 [Solirubrobacteraceae bacterium]|jgi:hypothetical protein|nr:hypothetical protein [Solirubrobacteraceae bacterium]
MTERILEMHGTTALPSPAPDAAPAPSPAWERLEDQLGWYDRNSARCKRGFHSLKVAQIVVAASIPVIAALGAATAVAGVLGAVIVVLEGLQQLFQYQQNWTSYRATAESLKHEKYLYRAGAGPYGAGVDRDAVLAERVEARVSTEHTAWVNEQAEGDRRPGVSR